MQNGHPDMYRGPIQQIQESSRYTEQLRPLEPPNVQHAPMPFLTPSGHVTAQDKQRRQLPGLQDLLSPRVQHEAQPPRLWNSPAAREGPDVSLSQPGGPNSTAGPSRSTPWPALSLHSLDRRHSFASGHFNATGMHQHGPPSHATQQTYSNARDSSISAAQHSSQLHRLPIPVNADPRLSIVSASAPTPDMMQMEPRRDSARPGTSISTTAAECVGQRQIPGKGLCYVYNDGNTCPTIIDGEMVNPMWGTTKAGKARKRLAQACL